MNSAKYGNFSGFIDLYVTSHTHTHTHQLSVIWQNDRCHNNYNHTLLLPYRVWVTFLIRFAFIIKILG